MSRHLPVPVIWFLVGPDKASAASRYERGLRVGNMAPKSPLYLKYSDLKSSVDALVTDNTALKAAMDLAATTHAAWLAADTALTTAISTWDGSYDVFTTMGQKYVADPNDVTNLGGAPRDKNHHPLAMPIRVDLTYNPKKDILKAHVIRPAGMRACVVQLSTDPTNPALWVEQAGNGAVHLAPHPTKGTWWARAACKTAKGMSDFTTPVSVIVK